MYHIKDFSDVATPTLVSSVLYMALPTQSVIEKLHDTTTFFADLKSLGINTLFLDAKQWCDVPIFEAVLRGGAQEDFEILTNDENIEIYFLLKKNDFQCFTDLKNIANYQKGTFITLGDAETLQKIVLPRAAHFYNECAKMLMLLTFAHAATPCLCDIEILAHKERYAKGSLFKFCQYLIALCNENQVFINGDYQDICPEHDKLWLFTRTLGEEKWLIVINLSISYVVFDLPKNLKSIKKVFMLSNYGIGGKKGRGAEAVASLRLRPFEARFYQLKK